MRVVGLGGVRLQWSCVPGGLGLCVLPCWVPGCWLCSDATELLLSSVMMYIHGLAMLWENRTKMAASSSTHKGPTPVHSQPPGPNREPKDTNTASLQAEVPNDLCAAVSLSYAGPGQQFLCYQLWQEHATFALLLCSAIVASNPTEQARWHTAADEHCCQC